MFDSSDLSPLGISRARGGGGLEKECLRCGRGAIRALSGGRKLGRTIA